MNLGSGAKYASQARRERLSRIPREPETKQCSASTKFIATRCSWLVASPSYTYVQREDQNIERSLARAIAMPNQIVSLSGPTKTGKTVLCRKVLGDRDYVWVDGGEVSDAESFWDRVRSELELPTEVSSERGTDTTFEAGMSHIVSAKGSRLRHEVISEKKSLSTLGEATAYLLRRGIMIVIDDFHYIDKEQRTILMRNIKGSVFNGLKILLLSVTHRTFDAIKAETELTGRFSSITLPKWESEDLEKIPELGFQKLKVECDVRLKNALAQEAQDSPFLMQKFCWEICFDCDIEHASTLLGKQNFIPKNYDLDAMFKRIAQDAGLPVYQTLVAGPQSRKVRTKRPLRAGGEADIYQATLLAIAQTGPKAEMTYEELRTNMNGMLSDMMPQKQEISSALRHLANLSKKDGAEDALDWDEDKRVISLADPYLRFYLRWQVRDQDTTRLYPSSP